MTTITIDKDAFRQLQALQVRTRGKVLAEAFEGVGMLTALATDEQQGYTLCIHDKAARKTADFSLKSVFNQAALESPSLEKVVVSITQARQANMRKLLAGAGEGSFEAPASHYTRRETPGQKISLRLNDGQAADLRALHRLMVEMNVLHPGSKIDDAFEPAVRAAHNILDACNKDKELAIRKNGEVIGRMLGGLNA